MGIKLSNAMISLVILGMLTGVINLFYTDLVKEYSLTTDGTIDGKTPFQRLEDLQLMKGLNQTVSGLYTLANPTASSFDILGGLAATGIGFLKTTTGILTFPLGIIDVYVDFIELPSIIYIGIGIILIIYIGFVILDRQTQNQN